MWNAMQKAILFVSRQHIDKLNAYCDHILDLFALYKGQEHAVIEYN